MIMYAAKKITSFFIKNQIITSENAEEYEYSFEVLLSTVLNFVAVLSVSVCSNTLIETLFYLLGFLSLRIVSGGYHAGSHLKCSATVIVSHIAVITVLRFLPEMFVEYVIVICMLSSFISVFCLAPVEDRNNPIEYEKAVRFKNQSRTIFLLLLVLCAIIYVFLNEKNYALALALGVLQLGISLLFGTMKNKIRGGTRHE